MGAVLSQEDEEGRERPVAYFSKKLQPREIRYSAIEKECLGIVSALKHFVVHLGSMHDGRWVTANHNTQHSHKFLLHHDVIFKAGL